MLLHRKLFHMGRCRSRYHCCTTSALSIPLANLITSLALRVYLSYYPSTARIPGPKPVDYAFIGGLNFAVAMLTAPTITILARKLGIQLPILMVAALLNGGFVSASFTSQTWHLCLSQGALVGLGVGLIRSQHCHTVAVIHASSKPCKWNQRSRLWNRRPHFPTRNQCNDRKYWSRMVLSCH